MSKKKKLEYICRRRFVFCCILLLSLVLSGCALDTMKTESSTTVPNYSGKRVLMISSYSPSFRTYYQQINGVKSVLDRYHIALDNEFMDTKRLYTEENFRLFKQYLTYKLSHLPAYDAVITADDDATNFVMDHRQELFGETPVFFMAVNNYDNAVRYAKEKNVTGVFEAPSYHDTLQLAYTLNPTAKRVVGLVDATSSGQGDLKLFLAERDKFKALDFTALDLSTLTFQDFKEQLAAITPTDIVVLISVYRDQAGATTTFEQGLKLVLESVNVPVYHTYEHGVGDGLLGGKVVSHTKQGAAAGSQVLKYIGGTPVSQIPLIDQSPNQYLVDWQVLTAYRLDGAILPTDVVLLNKPQTFIDRYGSSIIIVLVTMIVEGILIATLLHSLRTSKKAKNKLEAINEELECSLEAVKNRDSQIYDLIYIDMLTGLSNRFAIYEKIEDRIVLRQEESFYVMFLDIDNFKNVNDLFGHDIGDALIKETGRQLRRVLNPDVQVGRFGGDEFVFLISNAWDMETLLCFIKEIENIFKTSIKLMELSFYLTISIGVSKYPEHGRSKEELIKKADIALYEAKKAGKDRCVIFNSCMDDMLSEQYHFQNILRSAFFNNEFELYYQPLLLTDSSTIFGFEALIRWNSALLGWVSPYRLITVAEEMGMIVELGEWIFIEAIKFAKRINKQSASRIFVSVNISTLQLAYPGFYEFVMETVRQYDVSPEFICLEMTETTFMKREDPGNKVLQKLSAAGFSISLDDFGTGYSSLSYLKQFKIDLLKIDQIFIESFVQDTYDRNLVELVISIAKQKTAYVVAEGVERQEQYELLSAMNCDIVQGYYISKPLPALEALEYLAVRT